MSESFAEGLVGIVLDDRYRLDAVLGEGGMGAVYRAHHLAMDRKVAVKLLKPHLTTDDHALQRFSREARSTMKVDSDHAVKVLDFGITPQRDYYMVLEYLDGRTVQRELDIDGPFSPLRCVHVARQVLHALGAAHDKGLVHRDIKPDNILLMRMGADPDFAKVLDFGVAKLMDGAARSSKSALAITQAGMVFGTPEFMSPEQACGQPIDGRSDLYSLAATMFAMLTGCGMYKAGSPIEWLSHHARTPPPHLAEGLSSLAPLTALDAALQRCLAKRRDDRPKTAAEMSALLGSVEATLGAGGKPAGAPRGAPARAVFSPSSYIAAIDPSSPLTPDGAAIDPNATPAVGGAAIDPNATLEPGAAPPLDLRATGPETGHGRTVASDTGPTTTGLVAHVHGPRRGLWLVLGGAAILAMVVATTIIAVQKRSHDAERANTKAHAAKLAAVERQRAAIEAMQDASVAIAAEPDPVVGSANGSGAGTRDPAAAGKIDPKRDPATAGKKDPAAAGKLDPKRDPVAADKTDLKREPAAGKKDPAIKDPAGKARTSPEVVAHIAAAEAAQSAGNRLRQLAEADAALQGDPRNVRARFLFADALIASGDLDRGCRYLRDLGKNPAAVERARQAGCPTN